MGTTIYSLFALHVIDYRSTVTNFLIQGPNLKEILSETCCPSKRNRKNKTVREASININIINSYTIGQSKSHGQVQCLQRRQHIFSLSKWFSLAQSPFWSQIFAYLFYSHKSNETLNVFLTSLEIQDLVLVSISDLSPPDSGTYKQQQNKIKTIFLTHIQHTMVGWGQDNDDRCSYLTKRKTGRHSNHWLIAMLKP